MSPQSRHFRSAAGSEATAELPIPHPVDRVWEVISDYPAVDRFHPGVKRSWLEGPNRRGLGAERRCALAPMGRLHERVVAWDEGHAITSEAIAIDGLVGIKQLVGHWQVDAIEGGSRVLVRLTWRPAGVVGWMMDAIMIRPMFAKGAADALRGLARYLSQGGAEAQHGA